MVRKIVQFIDSDEELIAAIEKYQKDNGLPHFVTAVRKLCINIKKDFKINITVSTRIVIQLLGG